MDAVGIKLEPHPTHPSYPPTLATNSDKRESHEVARERRRRKSAQPADRDIYEFVHYVLPNKDRPAHCAREMEEETIGLKIKSSRRGTTYCPKK